jgi:hypothetical protein
MNSKAKAGEEDPETEYVDRQVEILVVDLAFTLHISFKQAISAAIEALEHLESSPKLSSKKPN